MMKCGRDCKLSIGAFCSMMLVCIVLPSCLLGGEEPAPLAPAIDWRYENTGSNDEVSIVVKTDQISNISICFTDNERRLNKGIQSCIIDRETTHTNFRFYRSSYATGRGTVTITAVGTNGLTNTTSFSV